MKPTQIYNLFLAFLAPAVIFSDLALYINDKELYPITMKHWTVIMFGAAILLWGLNKKQIIPTLRSPLMRWLGLYFLVVIFGGIISIGFLGNFIEPATTQFNDHFLSILFLFAFIIIVFRESAFHFARKVMVGVLILSVFINIYDFIMLDENQFSFIMGRAAGLYGNPNAAGIALTFGFLVTIGIIPANYKFAFSSWVYLGIILTQSRGSILVFGIIFMILFFRGTYSRKSILLIGSLALSVGIVAGIYLFDKYKDEFLYKMEGMTTMFERFNQLSSLKAQKLEEDPRGDLALYYFDIWTNRALFGYGMGAAYFFADNSPERGSSSHNQFLNLMVDFGLIGFFLIAFFLSSIISYDQQRHWYLECILFIMVFFLFSFTSHNMFDQYNLLFVYAMMGRLVQHKYEYGHAEIRLKLK